MEILEVKSKSRNEFIEITSFVQDIVSKNKVDSGLCTVFIPHTTAGVTINENADEDVKVDIIKGLSKIAPLDGGYLHYEGNSDAHIKASLMGFSENIIIENGKLQLGTWQGIYFCEFDGPRKRKMYVKIIG